ncbi:glycosyltransferase family 9 protein [Leptospira borgpetersenii]|uniref:Lipopolysaccharide heptosyltransferase II n=1 Tax=Leptospira borgpetersenii serovar Javanica str. UI 09931 TaxID=1049767 RepID=A0AAV3J6U2_LEPBO|nr:glycosyltransferase family 9 protein [Leptospira borgpetersenii]AXX16384.1 glycosyltransferase family 9 protein [Leptospira borgpetersenii serovar Ceylonica]EKQ90141.1 putative lipopolysaccharide heptosyltransferase II [Leptospira borgpetersenii str. UI 09149]EMN57706.1 putative lipopolysaccharide heptosyltransferase II [Leptospira borgpetersenii serovar Javanica str. MK146]EPG56408.1 putative lipopolysaccharide heptosyltransferase II [Leptospira borgpetersenii serovar Javanica str. UI 09931
MNEKILLVQTAFLGDLILTTSFFREVKRKYRNSHLTVVVNKGTESVLEANPYIDRLIPLDKKEFKRSLWKFFCFLWSLRKERYTLCILPHFSFRSTLIGFASRAKVRIGYESAGFSFLLTKKVPRSIRGMHEVEKLFSLLYDREEYTKIQKRPELFWREESVFRIRVLMRENGLEPGNYVLLAPSSVWETKRMPASKFRVLGERLAKESGKKVVLIGSKADIELCEEVGAGYGINFAGKTDLPELSFLVSKAALVISNDSSPIHFASAFNIPTLAVFGATISDFGYTPLADSFFISEIQGLYCRPCGIHGGKVCPEGHFRCMKEQNVDKMFEAAIQLERGDVK